MALLRSSASLSVMAFALLFALMGCKGSDASSGSIQDLPSSGDPDGEDAGPAPGKFAVTVASQWGVTNYIHKFGYTNFALPCEIASTDTKQDVNCIVHAQEGDLYWMGLELKVGAPREICEYVVQRPYWYYKLPVGQGTPNRIIVNVNGDATPPVVTTCSVATGVAPDDLAAAGYAAETGLTTSVVSGECRVGKDLGGVPWTDPEVTISASGTVKCRYDYSGFEAGNCCTGKYRVVTNTTVAGQTSTAESEGSYGGKWGNCADGPGTDSEVWEYRDRQELPTGKATQVPAAGLSSTFVIKAPSTLTPFPKWSNVYVANMYDWSRYPDFSLMQAPPPLSYSEDLTESPVTVPFAAYEYRCLDPAGDIKHRIRVFVNDWNTTAEFNAYVNSSTRATANPNRATSETSTCGYYGNETDCNDFWDWDDFSSSFPGLSD